MSLEFISKALKAIFSDNSSAENRENLSPSNIDEQHSSSAIKMEPQVKCYVTVSSGIRNIPYKVNDLLAGKMDHYFKSKTTDSKKPSAYFTSHYSIFPADDNLRELVIEASRNICGENTAYVFAINCSREELEQHVAEGNFSKYIICAYNAKDFSSVLRSTSSRDSLSQLPSIKGKLSIDSILAQELSSPRQRR